MKQTILILCLAMLSLGAFNSTAVPSFRNSPTPMPPGKWAVDKTSSSIKFNVIRLLIEEVEGKFENFDGSMEATKPDFSDAKISFTVDATSLNSDDEYRDKHIKGEDFMDVTKYPKMTFVSTAFKPAGGNNYKLTGNLTIHGKTLSTTFDVVYNGTKTVGGKQRANFSANAEIDRFNFDLKWNKITEAGGLVVSKEVKIIMELDMVKL